MDYRSYAASGPVRSEMGDPLQVHCAFEKDNSFRNSSRKACDPLADITYILFTKAKNVNVTFFPKVV